MATSANPPLRQRLRILRVLAAAVFRDRALPRPAREQDHRGRFGSFGHVLPVAIAVLTLIKGITVVRQESP
jgi:hypothetical protein